MEWFDAQAPDDRWREAELALGRDQILRPFVRRAGPCTLQPRRDYFQVLVLSIFNQQLATKTAATLHRRFRKLFPRGRPTPARVLAVLDEVDEAHLAWCGLSRQKRGYVRDLAEHFLDGRIPTRRFKRLPDESIIEALTSVKGVGVWTAQMFLLFALNRPDVWPVLDLGLQEGARQAFGLRQRPKPKELEGLGGRFAPWRSVATWYLWRGKNRGGQ
ncbi:MAG: DNA-3-methyladenine glycosylase 2 family protein [Myxococcota bacterium]